jgi:hypothetical protein
MLLLPACAPQVLQAAAESFGEQLREVCEEIREGLVFYSMVRRAGWRCGGRWGAPGAGAAVGRGLRPGLGRLGGTAAAAPAPAACFAGPPRQPPRHRRGSRAHTPLSLTR